MARKPILITDAAENPERELRRREIRYVTMMLTRLACLLGAAALVSTRPPLWGLWATLCVIGTVVLPWLAVLIANDRPAKTRAERAAYAAKVHAPAPPTPSITAREDRVIDQDEIDREP